MTSHPWWIALPLALALVATGCSAPDSTTTPPKDRPSADAVAQQLVAALNAGDLGKAPFEDPAAAQKDYQVVMAGMDGLRPTSTSDGVLYDGNDKDAATVSVRNKLPLGTQTWEWSSAIGLRFVDGAWKAQWQPAVVNDAIAPDSRLRHVRDLPPRAAITGAEGAALVEESPAFQVGVDKANLAPAQYETTARVVATAVGVDATSYVKRVTDAGPKAFVPAITLRQGQVPDVLKNTPGVLVTEVTRPLAPSPSFAVGLLGSAGEATPEVVKASKGDVLAGDVVGTSGLQKRYDAQLRGTVGHRIEVVPRSTPSASPSPETAATPSSSPSSQAATLFTTPAKPGTPLALTLDPEMQARAEKVLAGQQGVASLVVVKVGTGEVLAAANSPAAQATPTATFGRLAPGSTFKVVTSLALLRKGLTPASTVPCTATVNVGGRNFKNYTDFPSSKVGSITLTDALANSCNTAFISQASKLGPKDLASAAASLGMGVDQEVGFSSFYGSVPTAPDEVTKAADMIGQGTVEASPMAMAGVAASVASGRTVLPWLVVGKKPEPSAAPLAPAEAAGLQTMMKAVVSDGSGRVLTGLVDGAKTGTAEYGTATPPRTHAWMIAWNKQYAVAAMVNDGASGSGTAGPLIKALLQG